MVCFVNTCAMRICHSPIFHWAHRAIPVSFGSSFPECTRRISHGGCSHAQIQNRACSANIGLIPHSHLRFLHNPHTPSYWGCLKHMNRPPWLPRLFHISPVMSRISHIRRLCHVYHTSRGYFTYFSYITHPAVISLISRISRISP